MRKTYLDKPLHGSGDVLGELRTGDGARGAPEVLRWNLECTLNQSSTRGLPDIIPVETSSRIPATSGRQGQSSVSSSK